MGNFWRDVAWLLVADFQTCSACSSTKHLHPSGHRWGRSGDVQLQSEIWRREVGDLEKMGDLETAGGLVFLSRVLGMHLKFRFRRETGIAIFPWTIVDI